MLIRIWRKLGLDKHQVYELLTQWEFKHNVDLSDCEKEVNYVFNNNRNPYSCDSAIMSHFCDSDCVLYEHKGKNKKLRSSTDLLDILVRDIHDDRTEIANFSTLFPEARYSFELGEVVAFVGPEKSGKSSFIYNWFLSMRHRDPQPKILNVHLEMGEKEEISRWVQIFYNLRINSSKDTNEIKDHVIDGVDFLSFKEATTYVTYYNDSRYSKDILNMMNNQEWDIVYIDSFDVIQDKSTIGNDTTRQKELIAEFSHLARKNDFLLIIVHHQNKMGDEFNITPKSLAGTMEISYQADHIIGFQNIRDQPRQRTLKKIRSRRHADLDFTLHGNPETMIWKLTT